MSEIFELKAIQHHIIVIRVLKMEDMYSVTIYIYIYPD